VGSERFLVAVALVLLGCPRRGAAIHADDSGAGSKATKVETKQLTEHCRLPSARASHRGVAVVCRNADGSSDLCLQTEVGTSVIHSSDPIDEAVIVGKNLLVAADREGVIRLYETNGSTLQPRKTVWKAPYSAHTISLAADVHGDVFWFVRYWAPPEKPPLEEVCAAKAEDAVVCVRKMGGWDPVLSRGHLVGVGTDNLWFRDDSGATYSSPRGNAGALSSYSSQVSCDYCDGNVSAEQGGATRCGVCGSRIAKIVSSGSAASIVGIGPPIPIDVRVDDVSFLGASDTGIMIVAGSRVLSVRFES